VKQKSKETRLQKMNVAIQISKGYYDVALKATKDVPLPNRNEVLEEQVKFHNNIFIK
jgi:hypothetical protein